MSKQQITRAVWPLYLTIAVAAAASMATSAPPFWMEERAFRGPVIRLDETRATDVATFGLQISRRHADPWIEVVGLVAYELDAAPTDLRIALVTQDQDVLAEQIHSLEGAGRLQVTMTTLQAFACEPMAKVCEQTLALEFDAGSVPSGAIDIEWYVKVHVSGDGTEPPANLVFDIDFERGEPVTDIPGRIVAAPPIDLVGDDRWRIFDDGRTSLALGPLTGRETRSVSVRGEGGFSSSRLYMFVTMSTNQPAPVDLRLIVIPEGAATGIVAERVTTFTGDSEATFEIRIPQLLDCAPDEPCRRDFTIMFETEDELTTRADASIEIHAILDGEGEQPPAGVQIELVVENSWDR